MIKKLQTKFILLTICSLLTVLFVIIAIINILYFKNITDKADYLLAIMAEHHGTFPQLKENFKETKPDLPPDSLTKPKPDAPHKSRFDEIPYESRYFSVLLEKETGSFLEADTGQIVSVDADGAVEYANKVYEQKQTRGFIDNFRFLCYEEGINIRIIFLDCNRSIYSAWNFIFISIVISCLVCTVVALIIIFFSNRIIRPISESYEKQKRFITDASHEIKTPLTIINADTDILEMELEENEWVSDIKRQTKRLTELTNNLVLLARMEETENSSPKIEFPISDVVNEAIHSFWTFAQTQNKIINANIQPLLSINGDSKRIQQLITLLLDNAVKYSPENSKIMITLSKNTRSKMIQLTITNRTTCPLTKEQLSSLFDRFYRTDSSRNTTIGGYGIGLSVAKAIVESHGGKIKALSDEPNLLTIQVLLPI